MDEVADGVQKEGLDYWDEVGLSTLNSLRQFSCGKCGNTDLSKFSKEKDILDVWFGKSKKYCFFLFCTDLFFPFLF